MATPSLAALEEFGCDKELLSCNEHDFDAVKGSGNVFGDFDTGH